MCRVGSDRSRWTGQKLLIKRHGSIDWNLKAKFNENLVRLTYQDWLARSVRSRVTYKERYASIKGMSIQEEQLIKVDKVV